MINLNPYATMSLPTQAVQHPDPGGGGLPQGQPQQQNSIGSALQGFQKLAGQIAGNPQGNPAQRVQPSQPTPTTPAQPQAPATAPQTGVGLLGAIGTNTDPGATGPNTGLNDPGKYNPATAGNLMNPGMDPSALAAGGTLTGGTSPFFGQLFQKGADGNMTPTAGAVNSFIANNFSDPNDPTADPTQNQSFQGMATNFLNGLLSGGGGPVG